MFCLAYVGNILAGNLAVFWGRAWFVEMGEDWLRNIRTQLVVLPGFAMAVLRYATTWYRLPGYLVTRYWGLNLGVPLALFALLGPDDAIIIV